MQTTGLIQGAILCALLFTVYSEEREIKTRRKKCRFNKYMEQINKDIDKRLKAFENKFEKYFTHSKTDKNSNIDNSTPFSEQKLDVLTSGMNKTRETLQSESYSLRRLQESMYSQEMTLETLNANFNTLDAIVRNLSVVVDKLDQTVRNTLGQSTRPLNMKKKQENSTRAHVMKPPIVMTYPKDCDEVYKSGGMRYLGDYFIMVQPERATTPFKAVCKIIDGAGWTVIQRRQDGRENFSRDWEDYKHGFGDLQNEFWLGNEKIHLLTTQDDYELKIDLEEWSGEKYYAIYERIRLSSEEDKYRLHLNGYHGNAGDSLTPYWRSHSGMPFSTYDNDNDNRFNDNCAVHYGGGWWYNDCFESHLNGKWYKNGSHNNYFVRNGIQWNTIHSYSSLKFAEMMIKPSSNPKLPNDI